MYVQDGILPINTSSILKASLGDYPLSSHNILSSAENLAAMLPALGASSVKQTLQRFAQNLNLQNPPLLALNSALGGLEDEPSSQSYCCKTLY
jgi:hypothetical protein